MKCFGGPGVKKKACRKRKCINKGLSITSKDSTRHIANAGKALDISAIMSVCMQWNL